MDLEQVIRSRRSIKAFDPSFVIDDAMLERIFRLVELSPSSFNLQHWRFVVVREQARKDALKDAAWSQAHVATGSAVVVVGAKLRAHEDAARANAHAPPEVLENLVPIIESSYQHDEQFQRDEAIRSASLAAMTLMLVAESEGLATCPMIGFVPEDVAGIVGLPEGEIPVMLVVMGKWTGTEPFPTSRLPLSETVKLETRDGPGL